ncbi:Non-canonical purine NTP pyrophosphatase [Elusimicrobium minutum Pei191]|uniref:dITP/XTP pyrophosphatase n=1 Tax=Elusimicrobium minutum (strain Pei191) TaxID=445932 RepID=IXTPA_ELUMP|nr:RdgB/HAM1 family non-canonical purine NTP pyrophosphatase [Elusimicrobium minutum]B2KEA9.1 RecName: Full=dITP/XTP pyrophosphatase; AltName: Full=Non-canonical purine NTP pyrophosphatase; AltName: Full=Non-standard purine NTP pyrophosphatase; AltName: Full=Nucleoside-triphosphate diphosphatase; AltName: Full=Nucleoside-triphosphate pyrophosphatase; Short=NTPase [Elusimicrobium minutum Pei191]ACC98855.1 Non-canonical purine NTP pyrophosphatase [Elusimicrobium minutum Pei191]
MKILLATGNEQKAKELKCILPKNIGNKEIEYLTLGDFPDLRMPEETGKTLEENAILKAREAARQAGIAALADDTGLEVDALNGEPGVRSARYAGEYCDPDENNRKLLDSLDGLFLGQRTARFKTVACLATPEGEYELAEGVLGGLIGFGYRGENGFGYDPLFIVKGKSKTLAELTLDEKNKISHRRKAFEKISKKIK